MATSSPMGQILALLAGLPQKAGMTTAMQVGDQTAGQRKSMDFQALLARPATAVTPVPPQNNTLQSRPVQTVSPVTGSTAANTITLWPLMNTPAGANAQSSVDQFVLQLSEAGMSDESINALLDMVSTSQMATIIRDPEQIGNLKSVLNEGPLTSETLKQIISGTFSPAESGAKTGHTITEKTNKQDNAVSLVSVDFPFLMIGITPAQTVLPQSATILNGSAVATTPREQGSYPPAALSSITPQSNKSSRGGETQPTLSGLVSNNSATQNDAAATSKNAAFSDLLSGDTASNNPDTLDLDSLVAFKKQDNQTVSTDNSRNQSAQASASGNNNGPLNNAPHQNIANGAQTPVQAADMNLNQMLPDISTPLTAGFKTAVDAANPLLYQAHASTAHPATDQVAVNLTKLAVQRGAETEKQSYRLKLDPPELGRVDIDLDFDTHHKVQAVVTVDKPETLALLQRDTHMLVKALQDAGFDTASQQDLSFNLSQQNSGDGNGSGSRHNNNHAGDGNTDAAIPAETEMTLIIDTATGQKSINMMV